MSCQIRFYRGGNISLATPPPLGLKFLTSREHAVDEVGLKFLALVRMYKGILNIRYSEG